MKVLSMYPGQWFEHDGGLHGNEDWKSPKKYAGLFQQILAGSKFCQNPFRKYCRYRYGFTLLRKHHISRGHSRDLSKESSGFEMILLIFFTFMST